MDAISRVVIVSGCGDCWWLTKIRSYRYALQVVSVFRVADGLVGAFVFGLRAFVQLPAKSACRPGSIALLSAVSESLLQPHYRTSPPPATPPPLLGLSLIFTTLQATSKLQTNTSSTETVCLQSADLSRAYQLAARQQQRGREASRGDREDCAVIARANTSSLLQSDARALIGTAIRRRKPS